MRVRLEVDLTVQEIGGSGMRSVHTPVGTVDGRPGDLIVQDPDGDCWVMPRGKFEKFCRPIQSDQSEASELQDVSDSQGAADGV